VQSRSGSSTRAKVQRPQRHPRKPQHRRHHEPRDHEAAQPAEGRLSLRLPLRLRVALKTLPRQASQELARRLPGFAPEDPREFVVNGSGTFSIGGPEGDNGLSGKKLLLDHYGPRVHIGGTALSGKDFWKPDRAGTLLARRLALAVVQAGVAREAVVQFVSFPGDEAPRPVRITTPQGDLPDASRWLQLLNSRFDTARA
jgi:S-adenosylmethionine synthetase